MYTIEYQTQKNTQKNRQRQNLLFLNFSQLLGKIVLKLCLTLKYY